MELTCPECGQKMVLRQTTKYTTKDGQPRKFYGCSGYPKCRSTHGAHPNGTPLGFPATTEVKQLRMQAHKEAERVWGAWNSSTCDKRSMYDWMRKNTVSQHIGKMDKNELINLIYKLRAMKPTSIINRLKTETVEYYNGLRLIDLADYEEYHLEEKERRRKRLKQW